MPIFYKFSKPQRPAARFLACIKAHTPQVALATGFGVGLYGIEGAFSGLDFINTILASALFMKSMEYISVKYPDIKPPRKEYPEIQSADQKLAQKRNEILHTIETVNSLATLGFLGILSGCSHNPHFHATVYEKFLAFMTIQIDSALIAGTAQLSYMTAREKLHHPSP